MPRNSKTIKKNISQKHHMNDCLNWYLFGKCVRVFLVCENQLKNDKMARF